MAVAGEQQTILIIDDEPVNILVLEAALKKEYRVYSASSGEEGLEIARLVMPDLILLDIMMPGMDGYQVCARLKSVNDTGKIPVIIFVTSRSGVVEEVKGLELGAIDYILKPLNLEVVKLRVRNHLEMKRHRDLLEQVMEELAVKNRQLEILARQDGLTGLANRRCFDEAMEAEVRRTTRTNAPLSLLLCDIDFFKTYNDEFGHLAGDDCLRAIGALMTHLFRRAGDLPARYGGEEFAVILADTTAEQALLMAENLRVEMMSEGIRHATNEVAEVVTLSIGVVTVAQVSGCSVEWITAQADAALYASKKEGRNRVTARQV